MVNERGAIKSPIKHLYADAVKIDSEMFELQ